MLRAGRPFQVGSQYGQTGPGGAQQDERVTEIVVGKHVVAGAAQQFAQVGQDVRGLVNAQNRETGVLGVRRGGMAAIEGEDGIFLGCVGVEQGGQVRDLQNFVDDFRNLTQFFKSPRALRVLVSNRTSIPRPLLSTKTTSPRCSTMS